VGRLAAKAELGVDGSVALDVVVPQIGLQATSAPDELEEAPTAVMVLRVELEVLVQFVDAAGQECDLDLGRTGIGLVEAVLLDRGGGVRQEWDLPMGAAL
jgi:hypothetical protein